MFTPATAALKFQAGPQTEAFAFLRDSQPEEPYEGVLAAYPIGSDVAAPPAAIDQTPLPEGPLQPRATCPKTGRTLRLHLFRDLSCVLLREREDGGLEVLPASLVVPSDLHDARIRDTPFLERHALPSIKFQGRPEGLRWQLRKSDLTSADIAAIFQAEMVRKADEILSAPPVADPRACDDPPAGARFAPHAQWPDLPQDRSRLENLKEVIRAAAALRSSRTGFAFDYIELHRSLPPEPWKEGRQSMTVSTRRSKGGHPAMTRDKAFDKEVRNLLAHPSVSPGAALRFGPSGVRLCTLKDCAAASSSHATLAALAALKEIAPDYDPRPLLAKD